MDTKPKMTMSSAPFSVPHVFFSTLSQMKADSYLPLGLLALAMGGHFVKRWNETQIISWEVEKVQNRLNDLKRLVFFC